MNNVSQISKAKRLTEEEVHAAAEEIKEAGIKVSSIEVYKSLGRGSLTTITNFLKTWGQEEQLTTTLPALIILPDALKKAAEQLIVKVWAESQELAEHEINSQREALRQAEAIANEKIAEAEAFSEEQTKQIETLETEIEELKKEWNRSNESWKKQLEEENNAYHKAFTNSEILEERVKEHEKQLKKAEEKITQLEALVNENTKLESQIDSVKKNLSMEIKYKNELTDKIYQLEYILGEKSNTEIKANELQKELQKERSEYKALIEKAAKLEGELTAWKSIKPETKKQITNQENNKFKQTKLPK